MRAYLEHDGMRVTQVADGDEAMRWLELNEPSLVVLDVMLPGVDGLEILPRAARARRRSGDPADRPGRGDRPDRRTRTRRRRLRREALLSPRVGDSGPKPASSQRSDGHLRRVTTDVRRVEHRPGRSRNIDRRETGPADPERVRSAPHAGSLTSAGVSRRQLLELVWESSPDYQDPATVTVHVGRLRQKIEADPDRPRFITTSWGVGYRFEP